MEPNWERLYRIRWEVITPTSAHTTGVYTAEGDNITQAINRSLYDVYQDYPGSAFTPVKARRADEWDEPLD